MYPRLSCHFILLFRSIVVVDLYPIAVWILKVNLLDTIYANRYLLFLSLPVDIGNPELVKTGDEICHGRHAKTCVCRHIMLPDRWGTFNQMHIAAWPNFEPRVFAIVKGFRYGIQL